AQINANIGVSYVQAPPRDFAAAIPWFEQAAQTMQLTELENKNIKTMDYLGNVGMAHFYLNQFEQAEQKYLEGLNYLDAAEGRDKEYLARMEGRLGFLYQRKGNLSEAIHQFESSVAHFQSVTPDHPFIANILFGLSNTYREKGDYEKALLRAEQARLMFVRVIGEGTEEEASAFAAKSYALWALDRLAEAKAAQAQVAKIYDDLYPFLTADKLINRAEQLELQAEITKDQRERITGLQDILQKLQQLEEPVEEEIAGYTLDLGICYLEDKQLGRAEERLKEALALQQALYGPNSGQLVRVNSKLGDLYAALGNANLAMEYYDKALQAAGLDSTNKVNTLAAPILAAAAMRKKADLNQSQGKQGFEQAIQYYKQAGDLLQQIQTNAQGQHSKVGIQKEMIPVLEGQLAILFAQYSGKVDPMLLSQAFQVMERGQSFVLLQTIQQGRVEQFGEVPSEVINLENKLKSNIAFYEKELFLLQQKGNTGLDQAAAWTQILVGLNAQADSLKLIIENQYPSYFKLKYETTLVQLKDIQKWLDADQTLIDYFVGEKHIYALEIENDQVQFLQLPLDYELGEGVAELRKGLSEKGSSAWQEPAHQLYESLLAPLGPLRKKLMFIPHGVLSYVPFEVLLQRPMNQEASMKNRSYLLKDHSISYNHSGSLWWQMQEARASGKGLVAFAPSFGQSGDMIASRRDYLGPLVFNQQEVEDINALYKGKAFLGADASLALFLEQAVSGNVLHLSTHAKLDDKQADYSYLAFYGIGDTAQAAKLFISDIYQMNLPMEMVVLSACETGIGPLRAGEGPMSMSRGFAYAGAKSIVHSLWTANDLSTAQIMASFYEGLKRGLPKDQALQAAKLKFLEENADSHPYYWSTFVAVGDMKPLPTKNLQQALPIALVGLALVALVGFRLRRRSK
ncbi:MAG: CHAT domain-containing tetratricopeptide repeat protein, partial [Bacteroidota bacterium]